MADLRNTRLSIYLRNQLLNNLGLESFDGGLIRIYTTAQPATPETAIAAQTLLVTPTMAVEAFTDGAAAGGIATAQPTVAGVGVAVGTAAWFRVLDSTGTNVLCDGSVGPSGDGNVYNLTLPSVAITVGMSINTSSFTVTLPMQGL